MFGNGSGNNSIRLSYTTGFYAYTRAQISLLKTARSPISILAPISILVIGRESTFDFTLVFSHVLSLFVMSLN